ncbi:MAG: transcription-repair coupling factor [Patescibacteria group bacterium]
MQPSLLVGKDTHRELSDLLQKSGNLVISGASNETAKSLLLSHLLSFHPSRTLLVTENEGSAEGLKQWLRFFGEDAKELLPVENDAGELAPERLQTYLFFMQETHDASVWQERSCHTDAIFVATRKTWEAPFPLYGELQEKSITLKKEQKINFTEIIERFIENGYTHGEDLYLRPGEYRRIGDVLDLYPIQSGHPYRVIFNFDAVEQILAVDSLDLGKTEPAGNELKIFPVRSTRSEPLHKQFPKNVLLALDDLSESAKPKGAPVLTFTAFPETQENHAHLRYLSVLKFYTLTDFLNDIRDKLQQDWTLLIVTKRAEELEKILEEERITHRVHDSKRATIHTQPGAITIIPAAEDDHLPHSLQNPDLKCALLTDREIFTLKKAIKQRSVQKLALDFITSLQQGDYVVHMDHGIGHFEGMTQKEVDDIPREYLELTYAGGDKLFVPVDQADKLSKYVHEEGQEPILTRLGAVEWKRVAEKMRQETREMAKELLDLYARRAKARGHAYPEDSKEQRLFEEKFPYQETPGQLKAIEDIKADMEDPHPMDRLVCGDVGFGKTEVAMRAAFKAAQAGKQVAVIAPITILADQHFRNFQDRMKDFDIRIDMMSRFRSPKEQKETIERLRKGDVQIVIGTHRLLQDDVKFLNLGLVVIDEEQRFGVKQKEKFKSLRASVDILTLTATPIPRTLNLGLHKLRDITAITTPPPGRLPIITEVRKYSDELTRQALLNELKRGGQSFVLHNRVETIDAFADKLRSLVPEATFVVGHGQLNPEALEERIIAFKEGRYDVLVSSTIIENGIDLPRANTLIVNEAEKFGLAQLYQLRGRVGRSKVQAYAYFLYHTQKLKDDAKKRLRAIVEACELGSGFQVAMRDLEIRGAGEILGASQSGTMQTVGVSHYLRMLKHAVDELAAGGREVEEEEAAVEIQLPVEALIPAYYIPDEQEKISVYQKLASSENEDILQEFENDLHEEYGELPREAQNLFAILRLKLAARRSGVQRIKMEELSKTHRDIVLTLAPRVTAKEIMQLLAKETQWRITGSALRIDEEELMKRSPGGDFVSRLTEEISLLEKKKTVRK